MIKFVRGVVSFEFSSAFGFRLVCFDNCKLRLKVVKDLKLID